MPLNRAGRPTCYRCFRPTAMCLCASIRPVDNRCRVTVLQHPRERSHPFGTVRFVRLGLRNSAVYIPDAVAGALNHELETTAATGLLYPSVDAAVLEQVAPAVRPTHLLVLDGTWSHASRLYRDNPWLAEVAHYRLAATAPSRYRIRKEPASHCLSTIEAVVRALTFLEPETIGLDDLLAAFDAMVDRQLPYSRHSRPPGTGERAGTATLECTLAGVDRNASESTR